jgi:7,8-dihydropterin-6-yl-methyl-4-(beta-D-ribofuranosyl)aminobenzene 5'-phosphate synthase
MMIRSQGGTLMKVLATVLIAAGISSLISTAAPATAAEPESKGQIAILYDAFGSDPSMIKENLV